MTPSQDLNCLTTVVLQKWPPHKTSIVLLLLYYRNDLLTRPQLSYYCCITEMTSSQDLNCLTTVVLQKWPPHKTSIVLLLLYYRNGRIFTLFCLFWNNLIYFGIISTFCFCKWTTTNSSLNLVQVFKYLVMWQIKWTLN
jgi:hypothetical protein